MYCISIPDKCCVNSSTHFTISFLSAIPRVVKQKKENREQINLLLKKQKKKKETTSRKYKIMKQRYRYTTRNPFIFKNRGFNRLVSC